MKRNKTQISFTDIDVSVQKLNMQFFNQINSIIDWSNVDKLISEYYSKGKSAKGREAYSGLLLFKICLLKTWYNLTDEQVEEQINDSLSFIRFLGLKIGENAPDSSTISKFRKELKDKGVFDKLIELINKEFSDHNLFLKKGTMVRATFTKAADVKTVVKKKKDKNYTLNL